MHSSPDALDDALLPDKSGSVQGGAFAAEQHRAVTFRDDEPDDVLPRGGTRASENASMARYSCEAEDGPAALRRDGGGDDGEHC